MSDVLVDKEAAELLRDAGFKEVCDEIFNLSNSGIVQRQRSVYNNSHRDYLARPALYEAANWLRRNKGKYLSLLPDASYDGDGATILVPIWSVCVWTIKNGMNPQPHFLLNESGRIVYFPEYDEALLAGIKHAITIKQIT